jgi:hypothetical protein
VVDGVELAEEARVEEIAPGGGRQLVDGPEDRLARAGAEDVDARKPFARGSPSQNARTSSSLPTSTETPVAPPPMRAAASSRRGF